ncbi:hypothetical protein ACUXHY_003365 [Cytobacillus horneckiae]
MNSITFTSEGAAAGNKGAHAESSFLNGHGLHP